MYSWLQKLGLVADDKADICVSVTHEGSDIDFISDFGMTNAEFLATSFGQSLYEDGFEPKDIEEVEFTLLTDTIRVSTNDAEATVSVQENE